MQNERKKTRYKIFVLIQKLNFIFVDESFNEMNTHFFLHLDTSKLSYFRN